MKRLILIDSHALIHRAFHALPASLSNAKGIPTNAIFGFMSVLIKMVKDLKPDSMIAAFDLAGPTFRHEEFAEYKGHRVRGPDELYSQIPYIQELLTAFGVPIFSKEGLEADDIIGTLSTLTRNIPDLQTVIVTGDLDTLQLVEDDKLVVFTLRKGVTDTVIYTEKDVKKRFGLNPNQLVDFKGLKGDPSDNIPGVPGIGEKTASTLIQKFKTLEKLYESLDKAKASKGLTPKLIEKLKEFKDQAFFSKKLATIKCDAELEFKIEKADWRKGFDRAKVEAAFKDLGLFSLVKRLDDILETEKEKPAQQDLFEDVPAIAVTELASKKNWEALATLAKKEKELFLLSEGKELLFLAGQESYLLKEWGSTSFLNEIFLDEDIALIGHDVKAISRLLLENSFEMPKWLFDTKIAYYLLNSDARDYSLSRIYYQEFSRDLVETSKSRLLAVKELHEALKIRIDQESLAYVLKEIELPLSPVLAQMEIDGIAIDQKEIARLSKTVQKEIESLQEEIWQAGKGEFNINSPQQLGTVLFERLGLKAKIRRTGKGALSTAASELEKLYDLHPIVPLILRYREFQKLKTTYIEPFPSLVDKGDGRLHTTYNQAGAATGRLSSENPNLQNIPIRTELGRQFRKVFVAEKGKTLLSCDYSQIELRIAAHISKDEKMSESFKRGEDIHTRTAAEIFNIPPSEVTSEMRREAKVLNFGVLYGMGVTGFQRAAGVTRDQARDFLSRYGAEFEGLAQYIRETKTQAHEKGYVSTIFGRRRYIKEIHSGMPQLVSHGERMAVNHPIQGTAADLLKLAMIKVQEHIRDKYPGKVKMLLQVHDELLFEADQAIASKAGKELKEIMEKVKKFDVPIVVDIKIGPNWAEME